MPVEIGIRFPLEFPAHNSRVQYPPADRMTNQKVFTVKLAEERIVFRQLSSYLVHLAGLIRRSYNEQDLPPSKCSVSQHTCQSSMYIQYQLRTLIRNHNSLIYLK